VQYHILSRHDIGWVLPGVWGRWMCNFDVRDGWGSYSQPMPVLLTILTFRMLEKVTCPQPLARAACFLGARTLATYVIHMHPVWYPGYFEWLFRDPEAGPWENFVTMQHWGRSLIIFLFGIGVDVFRDALFVRVERAWSWLAAVTQLRRPDPKEASKPVSVCGVVCAAKNCLQQRICSV
jgi:hypothetical protein